MPAGLRITFHGVRGSTPCEGPQYARYGGHSSCVSVEGPGHDPVLFDLGTGVQPFGATIGKRPWRGTVLLTHLHWDHVQGFPFFRPLHHEETVLDVYGPRQAEGSLHDAIAGLMNPPYFPVRPCDLGGDLRFHETGDDDFPLGQAKVRSRWVRHIGPTLGFRLEWNGLSVAYVSDHGPGCYPDDPDDFVPDEMLELCDGVDLLVHDAQHTDDEFAEKRGWGHSTVCYAVKVARAAGARRLALFHHDPSHSDDELDEIAVEAAELSAQLGGPEVFAAFEGLCLELEPSEPRR